ncbi:hypothetical protein [Symmachiella dynata]|uniref:hypothetical protein n=1 Tax=Symmachiella dynata TaxID=2527995 RepID=UPI0011A091FC|nr:hypothetical protein [Symmachiella dynata]
MFRLNGDNILRRLSVSRQCRVDSRLLIRCDRTTIQECDNLANLGIRGIDEFVVVGFQSAKLFVLRDPGEQTFQMNRE